MFVKKDDLVHENEKEKGREYNVADEWVVVPNGTVCHRVVLQFHWQVMMFEI